jgi:hypothetical protein
VKELRLDHHIVIDGEVVTDHGKPLPLEQGLFWKQKLAEEQEIWNGKWNNWKPEPNPDSVHARYITGKEALANEDKKRREVLIYGK